MPPAPALPDWVPTLASWPALAEAWASLAGALATGLATGLAAAQAQPGVPLAAAVLGLLLGLLLGRRRAAPAAPADASAAAVPSPQAQRRIAELEAALAAAEAATRRRDADSDAGMQAFTELLAKVLTTMAEAAENGRNAAVEGAAHADAVQASMREAVEEAERTGRTLAAMAEHAEGVALSIQAITATLGAVAEALAEDAGEGGAANPGAVSLPRLAAQVGEAVADLVRTLHASTLSARGLADRLAEAGATAESGSAAAQAVASASDAVGRNAVSLGLEVAMFLDSISRAGNRRRHDRYPTDLSATVTANGRSRPVRVIDVSRGGCALEGDPGIGTGEEAKLRLPGIEQELGVRIVRRTGALTGIEFTDPDPLAGRLERLIVGSDSPPAGAPVTAAA